MSISEWMDKQSVVSTHNGILFSLKNNGAHYYTWMSLEKTVPSEISQSQKDSVWHHLYEGLGVIKSQRQKVQGCLLGMGEEGPDLLFNRYRVWVLPDEKSYTYRWGWWLCNSMNRLSITELHTSKWLRKEILCYVYPTVTKKKRGGGLQNAESEL